MNLLRLATANIKAQPLNTVLNVFLLALGLGTITLLLLFSNQLEDRLTRNAQGIDMVVGAKGSPLQLVLSAVYHSDVPTGNVPVGTTAMLRANPMIKRVVPLALGDNFNGFRIVGTEPAYLDLYGGHLAQGRIWQKPLEAVLGSDVAAKNGLSLGQQFIGAHGLFDSSDLHKQFPYTVTGILAPTGTILDKLVLTPVESVWAVHAQPDDDEDKAEGGQAKLPTVVSGKEVTSLLVQFQSPLAAVMLPRAINAQPGLQAASPAVESTRLLSIVGFGLDAFRVFALLLIVGAGLSVFVALYHTLRERRGDLAVMRLLGGRRWQLFATVLLEGMVLSALGVAFGLALGHGAVTAIGKWLLPAGNQLTLSGAAWLTSEWWVVALGVLVGVIAALLPAISAARMDIARTLAE